MGDIVLTGRTLHQMPVPQGEGIGVHHDPGGGLPAWGLGPGRRSTAQSRRPAGSPMNTREPGTRAIS